MILYFFDLFLFFIIRLEIFTGFAIIGWTGDNMLVEREKNPGPFWFAVAVHLLIAVGMPALLIYMQWTIGS